MAQPYPGLIEPPIPGTELQLGPHLFFVPPMRLKDMKVTVREGLLKKLNGIRMQGLGDLEEGAFDAGVDAAVTILERSLKRNYPAIERTLIEDLLDVNNCGPVMDAVIAANAQAKDRPTWAGAEPSPPPPAAPPGATDSATS